MNWTLLLGLCRASDPYYAQLLVDKMLFMLPEDQARLRACMTYRSLMDEFLEAAVEQFSHGLVSEQRRRLSRGVRLVRANGGPTP
jgi:hypothetical protein